MQRVNLENVVNLPEPRYDGPVSVEQAVSARRSVRTYKSDPLTLAEISQLLWSAQGISSPSGYRTAPSAGALYPVEVYVAAGKVGDLDAGIYKYLIREHALLKTVAEDRRNDLCRAALNQSAIANAPAVLLFCSVDERITRKYGERGLRYIYMEIGHAAQNVCLQAIALTLGTVVIGAFRDSEVGAIAQLPDNERPVYIVPVGR